MVSIKIIFLNNNMNTLLIPKFAIIIQLTIKSISLVITVTIYHHEFSLSIKPQQLKWYAF